MSDNVGSIMKEGLWGQNVVFAQLLAMCPTMAVTTSGTNGLGMGLATTAVLVVSNVLVSMIRKTVSSQVRIPVFVVLIATLVTVVDMAMNAWLHDLYKVLGLFIPLIVSNCLPLARLEAFFDLQADPYEHTNLFGFPSSVTNLTAPQIVVYGAMTNKLAGWHNVPNAPTISRMSAVTNTLAAAAK